MQGALVFRELGKRMEKVMANSTNIAAVLSRPLVLEEKSKLFNNVLYGLLIVGLLAATVPLVGGMGVAVPVATLLTESMSGATLAAVAVECTVAAVSAVGESTLQATRQQPAYTQLSCRCCSSWLLLGF